MAAPQQRPAPGKPAAGGKGQAAQADKPGVVITPIGIACFVHVWEPFAFKANEGEAAKEPNYSLILVIDKKELERVPAQQKAWAALRAGVSGALKAKFGAQAKPLLDKGKLSLPWRPAEEYEQYGPPFEEGKWMILPKSKNPPGVVDERSRPILNQVDFYPGALARVSCLPWAYDTKGNKGCTLLLNNVQKAGDGERLAGSRAAAEDEFAPLVEGGDEDDSGLL